MELAADVSAVKSQAKRERRERLVDWNKQQEDRGKAPELLRPSLPLGQIVAPPSVTSVTPRVGRVRSSPRRFRRLVALSCALILVMIMAVGCGNAGDAVDGNSGQSLAVKDAAGFTEAGVKQHSPEQEFVNMGLHYGEMQKVLTGVQKAIDGGVWEWNGGDDLPHSGAAGSGGGGRS